MDLFCLLCHFLLCIFLYVSGEKKVFPLTDKSHCQTFVIFAAIFPVQMDIRYIIKTRSTVAKKRFITAWNVDVCTLINGQIQQGGVAFIGRILAVYPDYFRLESFDDEGKPVKVIRIRMTDDDRVQPINSSAPEKRGDNSFPDIKLR